MLNAGTKLKNDECFCQFSCFCVRKVGIFFHAEVGMDDIYGTLRSLRSLRGIGKESVLCFHAEAADYTEILVLFALSLD